MLIARQIYNWRWVQALGLLEIGKLATVSPKAFAKMLQVQFQVHRVTGKTVGSNPLT